MSVNWYKSSALQKEANIRFKKYVFANNDNERDNSNSGDIIDTGNTADEGAKIMVTDDIEYDRSRYQGVFDNFEEYRKVDRTYVIFRQEDIKNFYYYEKAISELRKMGLPRADSDYYTYYNFLITKANNLCDRMIKSALIALDNWFYYHDVKPIGDSIYRLGRNDEPLEEINLDIEYVPDNLGTITIKNLFNAYVLLKKAQETNNLSDKILGLNVFIHICHSLHAYTEKNQQSECRTIEDFFDLDRAKFMGIANQDFDEEFVIPKYDRDRGNFQTWLAYATYEAMLRGLPRDEVKQFLDDLSGDKYHKEFDERLRTKANKRFNWYKIAISQEDFYRLYAYSGLDAEDLKDNPILLYEMIEHLNYIRDYYLKYLIKEIRGELGHWLYKADIVELDDLNYKEVSKFQTEFYSFLDYFGAEDLTKAYHYFNNYTWRTAFGGEPWAKITEWTKKLNDIGEIPQEKFNPGLYSQIYKLIMILDTIHSIEHNTSMVLRDLPKGEKKWLYLALEVVKNAKNPYGLINMSKDRNLSNYLNQKRMIDQKDMENSDVLILNVLEKLFYEYRKGNRNSEKILRNILLYADIDILKKILILLNEIILFDIDNEDKHEMFNFFIAQLALNFNIVRDYYTFSSLCKILNQQSKSLVNLFISRLVIRIASLISFGKNSINEISTDVLSYLRDNYVGYYDEILKAYQQNEVNGEEY